MGSFNIDPADQGGEFEITQSAGDLIAGYRNGEDYSRISAYRGEDEGLHTGSRSETLGRHGEAFGNQD